MEQKILIVDDRADNLKLLEAILKKPQLDIVRAFSGEEALSLAGKNDFALILLDVQMPGLDGFQTAERLRIMEKTKFIPVIFVTAISKEPHHVFQGYDSGAVDYIFKPFDQKVLRNKVNVFLELHGQKKLLEKEVMERQRAEEEAKAANKLKNKFLSMMAHDLMTPFETLLGLLKQALKDKDQPLHPKHNSIISRALESGEGILTVILELLEIGKLRSGILEPKPSFMDALTAVRFSLANLEDLAGKKRIHLSIEVPPRVRLYADSDLFMKVIRNLVSNAIKFCKKGDQIRIFIPQDEPSTVAVQDTGAGIEKDRQGDLFKYEVRTSSSGTCGEKGIGLGLPLCHDIMTAHGGTLDFESTPGEGSVFYARLPHVHPTVLLVEDEPSARALLRKVLEITNSKILEAENGEEALRIMMASPVHLAIVDLYMPVMDGFNLLKKIRSNPALENTPVIVLTNDLKEETLERAFQLKADDFTTKPIEAADLLPRVRRYV